MDLLLDVEHWTNQVLFLGMLILQVWAAADCVTRKAPAFTAANKLTKPAWVSITMIAAAFCFLIQQTGSSPLHPIPLIAVVAALVYLVDVRPAVREISGGRY